MLEFLLNLFGSSNWQPYGNSFAWNQPLLSMMVIADVLLGLTFFLVGLVLIRLIHGRIDLAHRRMFMIFGYFIIGCGVGYFVRLWAIYAPVYRLQAWVDLATAVASIATLALLLPILPAVYRLPSPSQLQQVNERLEFRVQERTQELEQINAALKDSEARLAGIINNAMDAIISVNQKEEIVLFNRAAEETFRISAHDALGLPIATFIPEPYRHSHKQQFTEFIETGKTNRSMKNPPTVPAMRADGSEFPVEATISQVKVSGESIYTVILRDVTSQVQAKQEREELLRLEQQARIAAEEASAVKSEFLGMVSHELRTPLTSIMGFASTLLAEDVTFDPDAQREFISIINQESGKLKDLVEQLLDVTRIHAKTLSIQLRPQPLANVLEVAEAQLNTLVQAHDLKIEVPPDLPLVNADEKRIGQVIVNLVDNAVKFSPEGTRITVYACAKNNEVWIEVLDEGIGIPETHREWVFEPFRQVGEHFTSRGAGLGLAICKGLVEAHGGRIWIESGEKHGTTVIFTLPTAEA